MAKLTYEDKIETIPTISRKHEVTHHDFNEIKQSVNDLYDEKENLANKELTTLDNDVDKYPNNDVVKNYVDIRHIYYSSEDLTESTTSLLTYQNKLTYTFTPVAGTYKFEWCCQIANVADDKAVSLRIQKDSDTPYFDQILKPRRGINDHYCIYSGFAVVNLTGVETSFKVDYMAMENTAHIKNVRLFLHILA